MMRQLLEMGMVSSSSSVVLSADLSRRAAALTTVRHATAHHGALTTVLHESAHHGALTTVRSPAALSPPPRMSSVEDGIPRLRMSSINRVAGSARRAAPPLHTNPSSHHRRAGPPLANGTMPEAQRLPPPDRWVRQPTVGSSPDRWARQPTNSRVRQPTSSRSGSSRALTAATSSAAPTGAGVGVHPTPSVASGALTLPPDEPDEPDELRALTLPPDAIARTFSSTRQRGAAHTERLTTSRVSTRSARPALLRRVQGPATGTVHV